MDSSLKILGIHDGHNASISLLVGNKIVYALSEERITRNKNQGGMPINSIARLMSDLHLTTKDIDIVSICGTVPPKKEWTIRNLIFERYKVQSNYSPSIFRRLFLFIKNKLKITESTNEYTKRKILRIESLLLLGFSEESIHFVDHHSCHSYAAYYSGGVTDSKTLILTNDGGGDGLCATISMANGVNIDRLAEINQQESFASLYSRTTFILGLLPLEHEYKVMGMAPYGDYDRSKAICDELLELFDFDNDTPFLWRRKSRLLPTYLWTKKLEEMFRFKRFDDISLAIQMFIESMSIKWVKRCLKETGVNRIVLGGGLFMNVKLNKLILEIDQVHDIFIMPSCSDESNSIGASYYAASKLYKVKDLKPIKHLYLGAMYDNNVVTSSINDFVFSNKVIIKTCDNINSTIAKLLSEGKIVARYSGREEFGARALGNRSILSDPSKLENIVKINKMIKQRDFWMPFAGSFCDDDVNNLVDNSKNHYAPYMVMTFDTTGAVENFIAATHPYDKTIRPQMVNKDINYDYYSIIKGFQKNTGKKSGLLNTSFNLHGYPIVSSPIDALDVFDKSGLRYIAVNNYLIEKTG
jgi:carbamoyltransferase